MSQQTRRGSLIEALINVVIGFGINFYANMTVLPLFGFHVTAKDGLIIGCIFTVISIARSYAIRRWFNGMIHNAAARLG